MGAFFSNIQLYSAISSKDLFRDSVVSFIKSSILKGGYIEINEDEKADRTVAISLSVNEPWISIYDDCFELHDIKLLDKISSKLSKEFKTKAMGIIVSDSDFIRLTTFQNGNFIDEYSNMKIRKKQNLLSKGFFEDIIVNGFTFQDFSNIFSEQHVFIEEMLQKIAEITNMNTEKCTTGIGYLKDQKIGGLTYLRFKDKNKKNRFDKKADFTELRLTGTEGYFQKKVGEECLITVLFRNQGISSKGLQIILNGPAIESNGIKPINVQLFLTKSNKEYNQDCGKLWNTIDKNNRILFVADFPEFTIPEGLILPHLGEAKSKKEIGEIFEIQRETGFGVRIKLKGLVETKSEFYVFALPLSNPMKGQANYTIDVNISN